MAGYTRQSAASITSGATITASPINAELNKVLAAFVNTTGHKHDGTAAEGPVIGLIGDPGVVAPLNKVVVDNTNNRIGVFVDASGGGSTVEQIRISDGAILPVTDNDINLGANGAEFKDLRLDGTAYIDILEVHEGSTITGALTVSGTTALNGGLTMDSNKFTVADASGNVTTAGTLAVASNATVGGTLAVTSNTTVGGTLGVTSNTTVGGTLAVTSAITANAGVVIDNITIDGTEIDLSTGDLTLDVAGDIILNTDDGIVFLIDDDETFGSLENNSGNLKIKSGTTLAATFAGANVDLAGTLDVSAAATFDSTLAVTDVLSPATHVDMPDNAKIKLGTGDDYTAYHDGTNSYLTNATGVLKVATETSGIAVTIGHTTSEVTIGDNLTVAGNLTVTGTQTVVDTVTMNAANAIVFEGATADDHETTLTIVDPTADRTINLPNQSGTVPVLAAASNTAVSSTPEELNIMDGGTSATSTTLADADRVVVNDAGTMKQVALSDFETYMETSLDTLANVTTVGALNAGSITSGFGTIDNGASAITTTGTVNFGSLADGTITITGFVDEDNMASNSATLIPTQQSVEARIQEVNGSANNIDGLTASAAEVNILDDATLTTAELNILDGSATTQATVTLVGTDGVVISDADVMKQALVSDFDTYVSGTTKTLNNKTLASGSITSGFGTIDTGASAITTTGVGSFGSLGISGAIDVDGVTNLDVTDIQGNLTVGVNDTGYDVKFFGATSGQFLKWTQAQDELVLAGDSKLSFHDAAGGENIIASANGHLEINSGTTIDATAPTIQVNASTLFDVNGDADISGSLLQTGVATFTEKPIANKGISVKNGATGPGFIEFFEDSDSSGGNKVTLIGPASTADVTLTLPAAAGTIATTINVNDEAVALAIALG